MRRPALSAVATVVITVMFLARIFLVRAWAKNVIPANLFVMSRALFARYPILTEGKKINAQKAKRRKNMSGIIVLTHNGRMPREGGIRHGYLVGNMYYPIGQAPINLAPYFAQQAAVERAAQKAAEETKRSEKAAKAAKFKPAGQLIFYDLPMSFGGQCTNCYSTDCFYNFYSTDQGIKDLLICRRCQQKMRTSR